MWNSRVVVDEARKLATKVRLVGVGDEVQIETVLEAWMGNFMAEFQSQHDRLVDLNKKADQALAEARDRFHQATSVLAAKEDAMAALNKRLDETHEGWIQARDEKVRLQDELVEAIEEQHRLEKQVSALSGSLTQVGLEREQQRTLATSRLEELTAMTAEVCRLSDQQKAHVGTIEGQRRHCDQLNADLHLVTVERDRLLAAIRLHHGQRADDRCWLDDRKLYEAAGVDTSVYDLVGSCTEMLKNCRRFVTFRCSDGGDWKSYAELEAELAEARADCAKLRLERDHYLEQLSARRTA